METLTTQDKAKALYAYLKELSALRQNSVQNLNEYSFKLYLSELFEDTENIQVVFRDRTEEEDGERNPVLIRVHKPEFQSCPKPNEIFADWLAPGWDNYNKQVEIINEKVIDETTGEIEYFDAVPFRVDCFNYWLPLYEEWKKKQQVIGKTRALFTEIYGVYNDLNKESETKELVVANGILLDRDNPGICHPLLTRRVTVRFDALSNSVSIEDLDVSSELYTIVLQKIAGIDKASITKLNDELYDNDYHPLDRVETPRFLSKLVHSLSPQSVFSDAEVPNDWAQRNRFLLYCAPVFIFRKRLDGNPRFLQSVVENIEETGWVPLPIAETVAGGKITINEKDHEPTIEEQLAAVGGEDENILLSKEANREQLEIAQRISMYNAVLVQGPPGTGKTHTIANLLGHFLAQGNSVLVTSQTPKALQVLKDKLSDNIKPLCVSVLNDKNTDMEKSVDGISGFMSRYTANELKKEADILRSDRKNVLIELGAVRRKLYSVIDEENGAITIGKTSISPSKAARFVYDNAETLSYIPGHVRLYEEMPLSYQEIIDVYRSNESIGPDEEKELQFGLPNPKELSDREEFKRNSDDYEELKLELKELSERTGWKMEYVNNKGTILDIGYGEFVVPVSSKATMDSVKEYVASFGQTEEWMKYAAIDGQKGGAYRKRWEKLIEQIQETCRRAEQLVEDKFGKEVYVSDEVKLTALSSSYQKLLELFRTKKKVSKLDFLVDKNLKAAFENIKINGNPISNEADAKLICEMISLSESQNQCAAYWKDLITKTGGPTFFDLDVEEPESIAKNWIENIKRNLDWYMITVPELGKKLAEIEVNMKDIFVVSKNDSGIQMTDKLLSTIRTVIPDVLSACEISRKSYEIEQNFRKDTEILRSERRIGSAVCRSLVAAVENLDSAEYEENYKKLSDLYDKYVLQEERRGFLERIEAVAPDWADAIRNREGVHGEAKAPGNIEDAWLWKQYEGITGQMLSVSYDDLQKKNAELGRSYRRITAEYAEKMAWYHLLKRTENDIDMKQALNGWKLTVRKIGKGTGKTAPKYKAMARTLMAKCQNAVPAWIMPMSKVVESLDPKRNQFDVIIVDEASQSDITALGVLYLAKKVIVVGDDKQVSPMAIGTDQQKMDAIETMYIKGVIPNSHLYSASTSLYDIAATTYQPLMLREHFRCVPDIIGFSNELSYDHQIKPLRDAGSSDLYPAVINYHVENGERSEHGKTNEKEADAICGLIKKCIARPEYAGKTFGVISLLGSDQAKLVYNKIYEAVGPQEIENRNILCGDPSHFQGDERDVVFLSLVDSNGTDGPLSKMEFGPGEAYRKRYNVAASRAKDQLWVVDSLDPVCDLKPGDIRKSLIEYSLNPQTGEVTDEKSLEKDEFETALINGLTEAGIKVMENRSAGAYTIGIVAADGKRHVAIECDGEKDNFGEARIRENMERQIILERSGWHFIRVRGTEYFRNPDKTLKKILSELSRFGVGSETAKQNDVPNTFAFVNADQDETNMDTVQVKAEEPDIEEKKPIESDEMLEARLMAVFKEREKRKLTERTSEGRKNKANKGGYAGGSVPFGYALRNGKWEIRPEEANTVKKIFWLKKEGKSLRESAKWLNEHGLVTKEKKEWSPASILYVLNNENTYRGKYKYGDGEWVKGKHKPILDD